MPKLYLTLDLDSLREVGEVLRDIEDNGLGKTVSNVVVDFNDEENHREPTIEEVLKENRWDILDEDGEFIKTVATEQIVRGDW